MTQTPGEDVRSVNPDGSVAEAETDQPSLSRRDRRQKAAQSESKGERRRKAAIEWGILIAGALIVAIVIRAFVFQAFYIPSESMLPTLKIGDRVLVNKLSYRFHDPNRGDVVVFKAPPAARTAEIKDLVKRVVGLPGETIEGKNGRIYINGKVLKEDYLSKPVKSIEFGPQKLKPDEYFLLGDNRQNSEDSTKFGPVNRDQLIGRAFIRIWPPNRLGFL